MVMSDPELATLTREECEALLANADVGRVAVVVDGRFHILPVNYAAENSTIVFRTASDSMLTEVSLRTVAFEVDAIDRANRTGWSVTVHGYGREITDGIDGHSRRLRSLAVDSWAGQGRDRWFEIVPEFVTGRSIRAA